MARLEVSDVRLVCKECGGTFTWGGECCDRKGWGTITMKLGDNNGQETSEKCINGEEETS